MSLIHYVNERHNASVLQIHLQHPLTSEQDQRQWNIFVVTAKNILFMGINKLEHNYPVTVENVRRPHILEDLKLRSQRAGISCYHLLQNIVSHKRGKATAEKRNHELLFSAALQERE